MAKRFILAVGMLIVLIIILFFGYRFFVDHESAAKERDVEEVGGSADLTGFDDKEDFLNI